MDTNNTGLKLKVITGLNQDLWRRYAEKTVSKWTTEPLIYWEEEENDSRWQQFRENTHPEPDFFRTWRRFSHKVQAQIRAIKDLHEEYDYLVWLDADVEEIQTPTEAFWRTVLPQQRTPTQWEDASDVLSYLGRGDNYHPETGFICYNLRSPRLYSVILRLEEMYLSGEIFTMEQYHDAYVWEQACRSQNIPRRNLCELPHKPGEAFGRSLLKDYYRHHKGARKDNL